MTIHKPLKAISIVLQNDLQNEVLDKIHQRFLTLTHQSYK